MTNNEKIQDWQKLIDRLSLEDITNLKDHLFNYLFTEDGFDDELFDEYLGCLISTYEGKKYGCDAMP